MKLFQKKYDIDKDHLLIHFSFEKKQYEVYQGKINIPYDRLNKKSRQKLDRQNQVLEDYPAYLESLLRLVKDADRYNKLKDLGYDASTSFEVLSPNHGTMSKEMSDYLNKLVSEPNILLGIHRIKGTESLSIVKDILENGLIMTSHIGSGAIVAKPSLSDNVSYYASNDTIIKELMYAKEYKNAHGSILIRIPDDDLKGEIFEKDLAGTYRLPSKYILGFVPANKEHYIDKIITLEDYKAKEIDEDKANELLEEYLKNNKKEETNENIKHM